MSGAETLSIVGSIIAIVQISKTILSICHFYIDGVEGAPSDLRVILIEVSALKGIAKSLQYLTQPNIATSTLLNQLLGVTGSIEGCMKALKELEALFPPAAASSNGQKSERRKLDTTLSVLAWPLKSGKAKKLLQEIIQHKTTINLALTVEFVHDLKEIKKKTEQIQYLLTETERNDIYKWLETTNPCDIHNRSQRLYEHGTGSWVHRTPEWPLWVDGSHRCLWLHGIPGAGKSILASYLAETIEKHCRSVSTTSKLGYAYYYCYFGHNQDESSHFLRWIIGQLCRQSGKLSQKLHDIYNSGKTPSLPALLSVLHTVIEWFKRAYIVLDAVDESMPREDLLSVIHDLSTDPRFCRLSLIVTSRRYFDIEKVMKKCSTPISMSNPFIEEDIRSFVSSKVQSEGKYQQWPKDLLEEMKHTIPKKAEGMFRWAVCQLDILKRLKPEVSTIKTALSNLPKTLDETYDRIFFAIPEHDWLSIQHVFHWLAYHNDLFVESMAVSTLLQAVQTSTANLLPSDADQLYDFEGLRECCGCLIMVEEREQKFSGNFNVYPTATTVSFAHYTVKEYLQSPRLSKKPVGFFAVTEENVRREFAEIALRQALKIEPGSLAHYQSENDYNIIEEPLISDFKLYCGVASVHQLTAWAKVLSSDSRLTELSEALVNPFRSESPDLRTLLRTAVQTNELIGKLGLVDEFCYWNVLWHQDADQDCAIFFNFLLVACYDSMYHLPVAFAKKHSMLPILTEQIHISREAGDIFDVGDWRQYEFKGTIPEMLAQWACNQPASFKLILDLISNLGVAHFDLSTLLLFYTGSHQHNNCKTSCILERLLHLGANANGPEDAFVTPLQIAVACWDLDGVETLLDAGANINSVGGADLAWARGSLMEPYNRLHGASSLCIIQNSVCMFQESMMEYLKLDEITRQTIESRLLESGAVEIKPTSLRLLLEDQKWH